jgi:hypothetical protein
MQTQKRKNGPQVSPDLPSSPICILHITQGLYRGTVFGAISFREGHARLMGAKIVEKDFMSSSAKPRLACDKLWP